MADSRRTAAPAHPRPSRRRGAALLAVTAVTLALLGLGMPPALAHDELVATAPADGASTTTSPASVALEFSGAIRSLGTEVLVTGPDGSAISDGTVDIADGTVVALLPADLPAGRYDVQWRATSSDGHPLSGAFTFTVEPGTEAAGESGAPASEPAVDPDPADVEEAAAEEPADSSPSIGWLAAGALLVTAGGLGVRRLRGRR